MKVNIMQIYTKLDDERSKWNLWAGGVQSARGRRRKLKSAGDFFFLN